MARDALRIAVLPVELRELRRDELAFGAGVAARGMRDNPINCAILGDDPLRRVRGLQKLFGALLPWMKHAPISAWRGPHVVGVVGMAPPGTCWPSLREKVRMGLRMLPARPREIHRTLQWVKAWQARDLDERHWHLGPVAVEAGLQGMGIGSQMMEVFCDRMDTMRDVAYLETDKPENVRFYERFGFETIDEARVLDTPNWFMRRAPA